MEYLYDINFQSNSNFCKIYIRYYNMYMHGEKLNQIDHLTYIYIYIYAHTHHHMYKGDKPFIMHKFIFIIQSICHITYLI
jgi:hypothetical protein